MRHSHKFDRVWWFMAVGALLLNACAAKPTAPSATTTPVIPTVSPGQLRTFDALWSAVNEHYLYEDFQGVDWPAVRDTYRAQVEAGLSTGQFADVIDAMLAELPEGAAFWQTRAERIEAETSVEAPSEGLGVFVVFRNEPEPHLVLLSVVPGSPAERAGLAAHDSILAVDGIPLHQEEGQAAITRIRGAAGSQVTLAVRSPGKSVRDVVVTRNRFTPVDTFKAPAISEDLIGYMLFPVTSSEALMQDVVNTWQRLTQQGTPNGLILDLRVASPTSDWPLGELLALFADGELGEIHSREETSPLNIPGQNVRNSQRVPLAILVGPHTDGPPEIFAAALQATGRATVIGLPTPGGVEQFESYSLPDGSRVFVTTATYRTADGRDVGQAGVEPDVVVEVDWELVTATEDAVRDAAIKALKSTPAR